MKTLILGASPKPERYAHKALLSLIKNGHEVILVNPSYSEIDGYQVVRSLSQVHDIVHTVTVYISKIDEYLEDIIKLNPKRVIFNPGTENYSAELKLHKNNIEVVNGCTLVMLTTRQY